MLEPPGGRLRGARIGRASPYSYLNHTGSDLLTCRHAPDHVFLNHDKSPTSSRGCPDQPSAPAPCRLLYG